MDERDGRGDDGHDISDELHTRNEVDNGAAHETDNNASGSHVTFDAGAALGGLAATAAANAAAQPPPPPPGAQAAARAAQNADTAKSDPEKEKHTYKITAKELADIEQATSEKATEKKLNRHWANLTFYFMASLSIILPSLFILLAAFIGGMNGKLVESSWSKMENPIKVAISAWPIVFAAVVAQCFKAYATFKVERGIKLMELEQLVGSSSFASAIKQPVLLRRLDLLTLALFAVWCLSPLGSQALLRVYSLDRRVVYNPSEVKLVPNYGDNRMWSLDTGNKNVSDNTDYDELLQLVDSYYISALTPIPWTAKLSSDRYLHPIMFTSFNESNPVQAFGSSLTYPESQLTDNTPSTASAEKAESTIPRYETLTFKMSYSYFRFSCDAWQNKTKKELDAADDFYIMYSESGTLGLVFTAADNTTTDYNGIRFASANLAVSMANSTAVDDSGTTGKAPWEDDYYHFSYIECGLKQVFEEVPVSCYTYTTTDSPDCESGPSTPLPAERTKDMKTPFGDFSLQLAYANPGVLGSPATLAEMFLFNGSVSGNQDSNNNGKIMSKDLALKDFELRFGYLFNTYLGLGYCPECVTLFKNWQTATQPAKVSKLYKTITAQVEFANDLIYVISGPWLAAFSVCAAILFLAGLAGVAVESMTVAPDVLGYVSTVARNSRYLQLPKTSSAMSGGERAKTVGGVRVMMQDVKGNANVGKIALGLKHEKAQRLVPGRLYR
ncbi:hypothetical protein CONLIGDRAFT_345385 [Coniochaeta ligniaria NRRL 30616]|uniref:Uncharacterized protein n=1 Tax=Coniochaeta ligniaria NRRL 30616 TaxID=1408157 RepID=A0A1J7IQ97_9PEZI|nr:hypothetical protein CONLIGDRAFT_345385 [Coniochaeta ligniaria NRRL 30616]